jgi:hypothetical protein
MSNVAWVIVNKKSGMLHFTLRSTKKAAKEELCHNYCICWDEAKSDGYYTQKVTIEPVIKANTKDYHGSKEHFNDIANGRD